MESSEKAAPPARPNRSPPPSKSAIRSRRPASARLITSRLPLTSSSQSATSFLPDVLTAWASSATSHTTSPSSTPSRCLSIPFVLNCASFMFIQLLMAAVLIGGHSRVGARVTEAIDGHCDDDDSADDDLLDIVGPAHLLTTVAQKSHYQGSDH